MIKRIDNARQIHAYCQSLKAIIVMTARLNKKVYLCIGVCVSVHFDKIHFKLMAAEHAQ